MRGKRTLPWRPWSAESDPRRSRPARLGLTNRPPSFPLFPTQLHLNVVAAVALLACPTLLWAATPLASIRYSPDITVALAGTTVTPQNVAADDLAGTVTLAAIGTVPNHTNVIAYSVLRNGDQLLAFDTSLSLSAGLTVRPGDVIRFDGVGYAVEFDAEANSVPNGVLTDAVGVIGPGDLLLSFDVTVTIGGITAAPEDLLRFKDGALSLFFDGSMAGVPAGLNLDAVHCLTRNGHLLMSFDGSGMLGGVSFDDEDVLEYDPASGSWELAYDGSAEQLEWPAADLAALSVTAALPDAGAPVIGGTTSDPNGGGGTSSLQFGTLRVFGAATPNAKPGDTCIAIYAVGANGRPDSPPGSVDDEILGTGGTDELGNLVDVSGTSGIPLSRPLGGGDRVFAYDACEELSGAVVTVIVPAPALTPIGLGCAVGLLLIVAFSARKRTRPSPADGAGRRLLL